MNKKSKLLKVGTQVLIIPTSELGEVSEISNNLFLVNEVLYTEKDLEVYVANYRQDYILRYKEDPTKALDRWTEFLNEVKPTKGSKTCRPTADKYLSNCTLAKSARKISTPHMQDLDRKGL